MIDPSGIVIFLESYSPIQELKMSCFNFCCGLVSKVWQEKTNDDN